MRAAVELFEQCCALGRGGSRHLLMLAVIAEVVGAGCQGLLPRERSLEELEDITQTKQAESRYWPTFKPDRDLRDPLWTP